MLIESKIKSCCNIISFWSLLLTCQFANMPYFTPLGAYKLVIQHQHCKKNWNHNSQHSVVHTKQEEKVNNEGLYQKLKITVHCDLEQKQ